MKKFWNWIRNSEGERTLRLEGPIDEDSVWGDEITPKAFRAELEEDTGDITVWICSPGGNVFAAAEIYTMLREYPGTVTVKIDSIAASAASVVAMAGDRVLMSPTGMLMIHDPSTIAMGNSEDMRKAIDVLNEVKESIINAYMAKTSLSHARIANFMSNETWMNAKKAVELGFADGILFEDADSDDDPDEEEDTDEDNDEKPLRMEAQLYSTRRMGQAILNRLGVSNQVQQKPVDTSLEKPDGGAPIQPTIGMDGTTEDGSVPYLILQKQLEYLR